VVFDVCWLIVYPVVVESVDESDVATWNVSVVLIVCVPDTQYLKYADMSGFPVNPVKDPDVPYCVLPLYETAASYGADHVMVYVCVLEGIVHEDNVVGVVYPV
jgi:hypothetical protein